MSKVAARYNLHCVESAVKLQSTNQSKVARLLKQWINDRFFENGVKLTIGEREVALTVRESPLTVALSNVFGIQCN